MIIKKPDFDEKRSRIAQWNQKHSNQKDKQTKEEKIETVDSSQHGVVEVLQLHSGLAAYLLASQTETTSPELDLVIYSSSLLCLKSRASSLLSSLETLDNAESREEND